MSISSDAVGPDSWYGLPSPPFFVNVAAKGFRHSVSSLESTLVGIPYVLILKAVTGARSSPEGNWNRDGGSEGVGGTGRRASPGKAGMQKTHMVGSSGKNRADSTHAL